MTRPLSIMHTENTSIETDNSFGREILDEGIFISGMNLFTFNQPVGEIPHDDPGDGEHHDEARPRQDLVLPALAREAPDTAGHCLAPSLNMRTFRGR